MAYDPLLSSMASAGAWCSDAFHLAPIEGMGAGALASRPIPAGSPLFHLPLGYLLTPWTSALGPALAADGGAEAWAALEEKGWAQLMLAMMYEQSLGARSKWAGYLATMPSEFGAPMWWSDAELEALKGTDIAGTSMLRVC
jgi:SET domain-containing protein 6